MVAKLAARTFTAEDAEAYFRLVEEARLAELLATDPVLAACRAGHEAGPHFLTRLLDLLRLQDAAEAQADATPDTKKGRSR